MANNVYSLVEEVNKQPMKLTGVIHDDDDYSVDNMTHIFRHNAMVVT